jgi:hypothetical protein
MRNTVLTKKIPSQKNTSDSQDSSSMLGSWLLKWMKKNMILREN